MCCSDDKEICFFTVGNLHHNSGLFCDLGHGAAADFVIAGKQ